jgi:serine/threonine protein kinase
LAAAHSVGIIHRDVKPSNILIEERKDGSIQVRLTDFGIGQLTDREVLARAGITTTGFTQTVSALTEFSSYTGTRLYMAPELTAGRPPSIQSDIYSLGVLLYQLMIGDLSEPMTTDWERGVRDPLLRDDLHHCLAGEPAERFSSADELAQRLRALPQRRRQWRTKRLLKATALACAVALTIGFLGWIAFTAYQNAKPLTPEQLCTKNLQRIHVALVRYRKNHNGEMPDWLSDLVSNNYISTSTLLCSNNPPGGLLPKDPNLPCSYCYEFSRKDVPGFLRGDRFAKGAKSIREWKERERQEYGDIVPTVRCFWHGYERLLNLSYDGKIYPSGTDWKKELLAQRSRNQKSRTTDAHRFTLIAKSNPKNLRSLRRF